MARQQWAQFSTVRMGLGIVLLLGSFLASAALVWHPLTAIASATEHGPRQFSPLADAVRKESSAAGRQNDDSAAGAQQRIRAVFAALQPLSSAGGIAVACIGLQSLSYFSDSFNMGEGHVVNFFTATLTIVLTRSVLLRVSACQMQSEQPQTASSNSPQIPETESDRSHSSCSAMQPPMSSSADSSCGSTQTSRGPDSDSSAGSCRSPQMLALSLGLVMLVCAAAAGHLGLTQRSSQEAMQKAPPAAMTNAVTWALSQAPHMQGVWGAVVEVMLLWVPACSCASFFIGSWGLHAGHTSQQMSAIVPQLQSGEPWHVQQALAGPFSMFKLVASSLWLFDLCLTQAASVTVPLSYFCVLVTWMFDSPALQQCVQSVRLYLMHLLQSCFHRDALIESSSKLGYLLYTGRKSLVQHDARSYQILLSQTVFACVGMGCLSIATSPLLRHMQFLLNRQGAFSSAGALQPSTCELSRLGPPAESQPAKGSVMKLSVTVNARNQSHKHLRSQSHDSAAQPSIRHSRVPSLLCVVGAPAILVMGRTAVLPLCCFLVEHHCLWRLLQLSQSKVVSKAQPKSNAGLSQQVREGTLEVHACRALN